MFWKSKKFKELQDRWYKKLASDGFTDVENDKKPSKNALKIKEIYISEEHTLRERYKAEYNLLIYQGVERDEFDSEVDKKIMTLFAKGLGTVKIAKEVKRYRNTVTYIRRKYEDRWGIRYWKMRQMQSRRKSPVIKSSPIKLIKFR